MKRCSVVLHAEIHYASLSQGFLGLSNYLQMQKEGHMFIRASEEAFPREKGAVDISYAADGTRSFLFSQVLCTVEFRMCSVKLS